MIYSINDINKGEWLNDMRNGYEKYINIKIEIYI